MNPEVQRALKMLVDSAEKLGALAWDQGPLVLRDLLVAGMIESGLGIVVGILCLSFAGWCLSKHPARMVIHDDNPAAAIGVVIGSVVGCVFTIGNLQTLLIIWWAPRAYLLSLLK